MNRDRKFGSVRITKAISTHKIVPCHYYYTCISVNKLKTSTLVPMIRISRECHRNAKAKTQIIFIEYIQKCGIN